MNKYAAVAILTTALVGPAFSQTPTPPPPTPEPTIKGGCNVSSWNAEMYGFYGKKNSVIDKLSYIHGNLAERRVFVQVTEGNSIGQVRLYEREKDGTFTITEWKTGKTSNLIGDIDGAVMECQGFTCVGEQVKAVLTKVLREGKVTHGIGAPASPKAAFSHSVKEASGDFVKTVVVILC